MLEDNQEEKKSSSTNREPIYPHGPIQEYFKNQQIMLNYNIRSSFAVEYVQQYLKYDEDPKEKDSLKIGLIIRLNLVIADIVIKKSQEKNFDDDVYAFKSGEELCDFSFVQIPSQKYIDNFSKCTTFTVQECMNKLPDVSVTELQKALHQISISTEKDLNDVNLLEKPILQIDDQRFQTLQPAYIIRGLPRRCRILLKSHKKFRDTKGKTFEKVALNLLSTIPRSKLYRNIKYSNGKYELDGILNFKKSTWLIECSSRPPSLSALRGNLKAISNDLKKSFWKCEKQVARAFENIQDPSIIRYAKRKRKGAIIIIDGVYPNLNFRRFWKLPELEKPRYVINYFDLRTMVSQPESLKFEEFLLWRTQKNMPIVAFDEAEYWAFYFDNYRRREKARQTFEALKKNNSIMMYVSARFNDKRHFEYMAKTGQISDPFN